MTKTHNTFQHYAARSRTKNWAIQFKGGLLCRVFISFDRKDEFLKLHTRQNKNSCEIQKFVINKNTYFECKIARNNFGGQRNFYGVDEYFFKSALDDLLDAMQATKQPQLLEGFFAYIRSFAFIHGEKRIFNEKAYHDMPTKLLPKVKKEVVTGMTAHLSAILLGTNPLKTEKMDEFSKQKLLFVQQFTNTLCKVFPEIVARIHKIHVVTLKEEYLLLSDTVFVNLGLIKNGRCLYALSISPKNAILIEMANNKVGKQKALIPSEEHTILDPEQSMAIAYQINKAVMAQNFIWFLAPSDFNQDSHNAQADAHKNLLENKSLKFYTR